MRKYLAVTIFALLGNLVIQTVEADGLSTEEFVTIPAGNFVMGDTHNEGQSTERPTRSVYLDEYAIAKTEVTKALWDEVRIWGLVNGYTDLRIGGGKGPDHPVQTVSWYDSVKWCNARSEKEGRNPCYTVGGQVYRTGTSEPVINYSVDGYRLPSEAEWEKAARGGLSGKRFPWGDTISHSQANYYSNASFAYDVSPTRGYHPDWDSGGQPYTSSVGTFPANGYGLYDVAGNVWEWCNDWHGADYYSQGVNNNPHGPDFSGSDRNDRGGGWKSSESYYKRCSYRDDNTPLTENTLGFRLASSGAITATPNISSVNPSPVTGSTIAQNYYINGSNFTSNSTVTLRDLRTGEVFPNRTIHSQSATQIRLRPIFTTEAANWSVEVIEQGVSSGQFPFPVLSPVVSPGIFYIEGPASIVSGETATYKCFMRNPVTAEVFEVSSLCTLGFVGQTAGSGIGGMSVWAGPVTSPTNITLQAYYTRPDDRIGSMPLTVTLTKRTQLEASASGTRSHVSGTNYLVNLTASATGGVPPYTYTWDLDEDSMYDDATGSTAATNTPHAGTFRYRVRVMDAVGGEAIAGKQTTVNNPAPVGLPGDIPGREAPDPHPPAFKTWNGSSYEAFVFDPNKRDNGLVVITHGIRSSGEEDWVKFMVHNIKTRTQGAEPNIIVYDWKENADVFITAEKRAHYGQQLANSLAYLKENLNSDFPAGMGGGGLIAGYKTTLNGVYKTLKLLSSVAVVSIDASLVGVGLVEVAIDAVAAKYDNTHDEAAMLAAWILQQKLDGKINTAKPIHLIGHSAGGYVVGECGRILKDFSVEVDAVTLLDTPLIDGNHIAALSSPARIELYISSFIGMLGNVPFDFFQGALEKYATQPISTNYVFTNNVGHGHSALWYTESARQSGHAESLYPSSSVWGFNLSPIINEAYRIDKSVSMGTNFLLERFTTSTANPPVNGFTAFGNATEDEGMLTLTESNDAILLKTHAVPVKANYLTFRYRYATGGDGDFLTMHYGNLSIFRASETSLNRGTWMTAKIPIGEFSGETSELMIRLASRGTVQAVIEITDLCIEETEDLDGDGVLTVDEVINGTDHRRWDTDGDFISDADEAPNSDPLKRDTDDDGVDDYKERIAGTSALDNQSNFKTIAADMQSNGTFNLTWSSVVGKKYRVQWSDYPGFQQYQTVSGIITATGSTTSHADVDSENLNRTRGFYRVVVYED